MCGRFTLTVDPVTLTGHFQAVLRLKWPGPRYNIAPGQDLAVVVSAPGGREIRSMPWGLVPPWARGTKGRLINARAETAARKPAFRDAFARRRCLVPADGYYEWAAGTKRPFRIVLPGDGLFALAGLWERRESPDGAPVFSCAVLTTAAAATVAPIHDRMPLILTSETEFAAWLEGTDPARLGALLKPYAGPVSAYPVGRAVNSSRVDHPGLIIRADDAGS